MLHTMHLQEVPFVQISEGLKTIEVRLNDSKRQLLKVGDEIVFINIVDTTKNIKVVITTLLHYPTFKILYSSVNPEKCGERRADDFVKMYEIYSNEEEDKYGVVGIEFTLI